LINVEVQGNTELAQIAFAHGGMSRGLRARQRWEEQRGENPDDSHDDQQFNQRERARRLRVSFAFSCWKKIAKSSQTSGGVNRVKS